MALTQVTSAGLKDGEIVNADLNSSAAIALSKLASTPAVLTGSTNNTLTTVTAANAITGEANLTFDGSALNATAGAASLTITSTNAQTAGQLHFDGDAVTTADYWLGNINGKWNGNDVAAIRFEAGDDTTNKDDGRITFNTSDASSTPDERMRIEPNGNVKISNKLEVSHNDWDGLRVVNTNADANGAYLDLAKKSSSMADNDESGVIRFRGDDDAGNEHTFADIRCQILDVSNGTEDGHLQFFTSYDGAYAERLRITRSGNIKVIDGDLQINTAGHGIDFAATSDATGATSEILDDYEEGTWTPTILYGGVTGYTAQSGTYTKVGRVVIAQFRVNGNGGDTTTSNVIAIGGLPFTNSSSMWGGLTITRSDNFHNGRFQGLVPTSGTECTFYQDDGSPFTWAEAGNPNNDLRGIITYHT